MWPTILGFPRGGQGQIVITDIAEFFGAALWAWWDATDISTLFQDTSATTPVTANNDPIGRISDKSGNSRNINQATAANRPQYKDTLHGAGSALFDKTNDSLFNTTFNLGADKEVFALFHILRTSFPASGTTVDLLMSSGPSGTTPIDKDTYNGFVSTTNNRAAQRHSVSGTYYVDGAPFTNGASMGTNARSVVMSSVTANTFTSDTGVYVGRTSDSAHFSNHALHQLIVIDRAVMPWNPAETVALHHLLMSLT